MRLKVPEQRFWFNLKCRIATVQRNFKKWRHRKKQLKMCRHVRRIYQ